MSDRRIEFNDFKTNCIEPKLFAELLYGSGIISNINNNNLLFNYKSNLIIGLILNEDLIWIVFHGAFDFSHLIQLLHSDGMPEDEYSADKEFMEKHLKYYFPNLIDLKH